MSTLKGKLPEVLPFFQSHRTKKDTEGALHQTSSALEQLLELVNQVDAALQAKCRDAQHLALELQAKMDALKAEQATLQTQAGDGKELFEKLKEAHVQRDVALARMEAAQDSLEAALKARDQFPKVLAKTLSLEQHQICSLAICTNAHAGDICWS
jgi:chromosome segregation ATPase